VPMGVVNDHFSDQGLKVGSIALTRQ
jgi:hypothetical protein